METKNIIIILIIIIVILAAAVGIMFLNSASAKEPCKIKITSNKTQYEGGKLSVQLTDLNKTPISKEIVNITITNSSGDVVVDDVVKTDSKGKAKLDLDLKKGNYNVTVSYGGNENYTGNNTTQKLTIKEEVVEQPVSQQSTQSSGSSNNELYYDEEINVYYNSEGITVDPDGEHWHGAGYRYEDLREQRDKWERGEPVMI